MRYDEFVIDPDNSLREMNAQGEMIAQENIDYVHRLADDIIENGFSDGYPILVIKNTKIIAQGHCRYAAVGVAIKCGQWDLKTSIPTLEVGWNKEQIRQHQCLSSKAIKPYLDLEANILIRFYWDQTNNDNLTDEQKIRRVAENMYRSPTYIKKVIAFMEKVTPKLIEYIKSGEINTATGRYIAKFYPNIDETIDIALARMRKDGKTRIMKRHLPPLPPENQIYIDKNLPPEAIRMEVEKLLPNTPKGEKALAYVKLLVGKTTTLEAKVREMEAKINNEMTPGRSRMTREIALEIFGLQEGRREIRSRRPTSG
jgi:hypothetical protein